MIRESRRHVRNVQQTLIPVNRKEISNTKTSYLHVHRMIQYAKFLRSESTHTFKEVTSGWSSIQRVQSATVTSFCVLWWTSSAAL